jgi:arylsulfatase A-like enzyme
MPDQLSITRRGMLKTGAGVLGAEAVAGAAANASARPNVVLVISDQFRADCVGAMGRCGMDLTPNLDRMAASGVMFRAAMSNQPVCAPARATIFTGQYSGRHGVWRNGFGLAEGAATLATEMGRAGYSTNYIGKWHLARPSSTGPRADAPVGPVEPAHRGGFTGLWEASNVLEMTSHAYSGEMYDNAGTPLRFDNEYRADFLTSRAVRFLESPSARSPFLLTVSFLETHHQNDRDSYDAPREYAGRYKNAWVPPDLRALPGSWPGQLGDYYGCVSAIDACMGRLRRTLASTGLARNTILVFTSDHGCHFRTRNTEYKRSPHDSSLHVPLIIEGPGFQPALAVDELVSHVDYTPTLLDAVGLRAPAQMQGRSFLPLVKRDTAQWRNEVYFELSEYVTGRGLRTPRYTYAAIAPRKPDWRDAAGAGTYVDYVLYDNHADRAQLVNLAGRASHQDVARQLRERLLARLDEAGQKSCAVEPSWFPYS